MRMKQRAPIITAVKRKIYERDAATIAFYRRNPVLRPEIYWASNYLTLRHICWNRAGMQVMFFGRVVETLVSLL
ncbi:MAG: hypothetical protein ACLRWM_00270 [Streptococcus sp.]